MASFLGAHSVAPVTFGYDVILLAGQSNMAGRGTTGTIDATPTGLMQYSCASASANYKTIMSGSDPLEMEEGVETGQIGPGHSFAAQYMVNNPGRGVLLVPCAHGSTSLTVYSQEWNVGNSLYNFSIARSNEAIAAAVALYPSSKFVGVAWLQGENDAQLDVLQTDYASAFDNVINGFRGNITGASATWFAVLGMVHGFDGTGVQLALADTPNRKVRSVYVSGPTGNDDGLHYNAVAQRIFGPNAANALIGV